MSLATGNLTWERRAGNRGHLGFGPPLVRHIDTQANAVAKQWAYDGVYSSKALAHVITGKMKASIRQKRLGPAKYKTTAGAFYSIYEEFGTRYREGHPFFTPGHKKATKAAVGRWRKMLKTGPVQGVKFNP